MLPKPRVIFKTVNERMKLVLRRVKKQWVDKIIKAMIQIVRVSIKF